MNGNKAIQVQDLHKDCGDIYAVQGVSFDVQKGETFGPPGPNPGGGGMETARFSKDAKLLAEVTRVSEVREAAVQALIGALNAVCA